jgi:hypothetical protein
VGKEEKDYEKNTIIDFFYKDLSLIGSFYSQIFNGFTNSLTKSETASDIINNEAKIGVGLLSGKFGSNQTINQTISSNINPLDSVILELIDALELEIATDSLSDLKMGSIQAVNGSLLFRDYKTINDILPIIIESKLVPELSQPLDQAAKGKNKNFTIGNLIQRMISILPIGLELEIVNNRDEHATIIIKEEYLALRPDEIIRSYGGGIPGVWTVIGIIDEMPFNKPTSKSQFKNSVDMIVDFYSQTMNEGNVKYVIKPIVIYRKM